MKTVIAEKPSVAREIAALLGAVDKSDGYYSGNGYFVTWAFGHLIALGMPSDYGISGFGVEYLPIIPNPFVLTVRKIKLEGKYIDDKNAVRQLKVIERLFKNSTEIIIATDAGREGELIFRYIYEYLGIEKPLKRLWISSLTEKAICTGFENLKEGSEFEGLYHAARARSRADWLVGINASQALNVAAGQGIYSLGRVQTPTLAMICRRFLENKAFVVKPYFQIELQHNKQFVSFTSRSKNRWETRREAQQVWNSIERNGSAEVVSVDTKTVTEQPPLLFDLTGLQKEANKLLNLSADETLKIAQLLYEKQFITYPRTGSRYIPEDVWADIPKLINGLKVREKYHCAELVLKSGGLNKRILNDLRVTDHHGLLVTEKVPSSLSAKESAIYDLIAFRLLEAVSEVCIKNVTTAELQVLHHDFYIKGSSVVEPGWRAVKGDFNNKDSSLDVEINSVIVELPELKAGDILKIKSGTILEKQTRPPSLFTEASLLGAMEQAGNDIEDKDARGVLKGIGIGTPATRAAIIETLFNREYIVRNKKSLVPTDKGLQVYELVKDFNIADVAMTAQWELALRNIELGNLDAALFQKDLEEYSTVITKELLQSELNKQPDILCPRCKENYLSVKEKFVKCKGENCGWIQFRMICGIQLSLCEIEKLVNYGRTDLIKGMKSKSGKNFDAFIVLDEDGKSSFEFKVKDK
ncbi:DNA topoisomerase-3 [Paenimyroides ummariense]|uniref:DNA topoisomerase n=1 Tax=Paenimyroides ummariense TaxID=913024 RepID=A0A1I5EYU7_9FLAO|nr:type IA DNA topoisomerase [Paenimyroides ummariense]SFO16569.1 DNA topoisomerase-3 [Paenimyroides ummariense]